MFSSAVSCQVYICCNHCDAIIALPNGGVQHKYWYECWHWVGTELTHDTGDRTKF